MTSVASIGAVGIEGVRLQAEFQAQTVALQKDVLNLQGNLALQLLQAAFTDPAVGQNLDVTA